MPKYNAKLVGCGMDMGFAPTWLRQVSPLLHMTTLTTARSGEETFNSGRNGRSAEQSVETGPITAY